MGQLQLKLSSRREAARRISEAQTSSQRRDPKSVVSASLMTDFYSVFQQFRSLLAALPWSETQRVKLLSLFIRFSSLKTFLFCSAAGSKMGLFLVGSDSLSEEFDHVCEIPCQISGLVPHCGAKLDASLLNTSFKDGFSMSEKMCEQGVWTGVKQSESKTE